MIVEDGTAALSPEEWAHERAGMAGLAIEDLNGIIAYRDPEDSPFIPTKNDVAAAFVLLATGLDWPEDQLARHRDEFERGLGNEKQNRAAIMRAALENLTTAIGYTLQHTLSAVWSRRSRIATWNDAASPASRITGPESAYSTGRLSSSRAASVSP